MKLKDILTKPTVITWRMLLNENHAKELGIEDIFAGECKWDGKNLISLDGDIYSLDEKIIGFLELDDSLIYWTKEY